ncbi:MAG: hypothetical protein R2705_24770 [Ilumatobacteraceae bacterium]
MAVCGAMDGVERVLAAHLRPGDAIAVEDPGYPSVVHVARAGARRRARSHRQRGMVPEELARSSVRCRPSSSRRAQNPTGAALTAARAARLTATLAVAPDVLVVHDDHSGDVSGVPPELVGAGDGSGRPWALVHPSPRRSGRTGASPW